MVINPINDDILIRVYEYEDTLDYDIKSIQLNKLQELVWWWLTWIFTAILLLTIGFILGQMTVKNEARNAGVGDFIMRPDGNIGFEFFRKK